MTAKKVLRTKIDPQTKEAIAHWRVVNPAGTLRECAQHFGVHNSTVYKIWKKASPPSAKPATVVPPEDPRPEPPTQEPRIPQGPSPTDGAAAIEGLSKLSMKQMIGMAWEAPFGLFALYPPFEKDIPLKQYETAHLTKLTEAWLASQDAGKVAQIESFMEQRFPTLALLLSVLFIAGPRVAFVVEHFVNERRRHAADTLARPDLAPAAPAANGRANEISPRSAVEQAAGNGGPAGAAGASSAPSSRGTPDWEGTGLSL